MSTTGEEGGPPLKAGVPVADFMPGAHWIAIVCATGVFSSVRGHSPLPSVEAAAAKLAEWRADAVIAVGGGSAIVTARAASIVAMRVFLILAYSCANKSTRSASSGPRRRKYCSRSIAERAAVSALPPDVIKSVRRMFERASKPTT